MAVLLSILTIKIVMIWAPAAIVTTEAPAWKKSRVSHSVQDAHQEHPQQNAQRAEVGIHLPHLMHL